MRTINEISGTDVKGMFDIFMDVYKTFDFDANKGKDIPICALIDSCAALAVNNPCKGIRQARRGSWKLVILMMVNACKNDILPQILHDLSRIMEREDGSIVVTVWEGSRKIEKTFWGWNPDERGGTK